MVIERDDTLQGEQRQTEREVRRDEETREVTSEQRELEKLRAEIEKIRREAEQRERALRSEFEMASVNNRGDPTVLDSVGNELRDSGLPRYSPNIEGNNMNIIEGLANHFKVAQIDVKMPLFDNEDARNPREFLQPSKSVKEMTRMSLYRFIKECPKKNIHEKLMNMEKKVIEKTKCPERELRTIKRVLSRFKCDFKKKWAAASHKEDRFLKKNELWLSISIKLGIQTPKKEIKKIKKFCDLNERSKQCKTKNLRVQVPLEELTYTVHMSQRAAGHADVFNIIKDMTEITPTRASKFRKVISSAKKENLIKKHIPSEALAIFVEGCKVSMLSKKESMRVTETCAEIQLQALLDHTISRLFVYLEEVIEKNCTEDEKQNLELITKWGCDVSQQCQFKPI
ncbi:hypothetical protein KPH14_000893 [Odynerus spinipes]|uniref:Uncharacterized protein n=1 Tax=Odynerus spinipes TaxID=1348599 RepID=A0AAD9RC95_9HYME|nr:hypothetical protein KPH14_000893 [Odynerus spinipes]